MIGFIFGAVSGIIIGLVALKAKEELWETVNLAVFLYLFWAVSLGTGLLWGIV